MDFKVVKPFHFGQIEYKKGDTISLNEKRFFAEWLVSQGQIAPIEVKPKKARKKKEPSEDV